MKVIELMFPGTQAMVSMIPTVVETSPSALQRFAPIDRDCYADNEFDLKILPPEKGYRLG